MHIVSYILHKTHQGSAAVLKYYPRCLFVRFVQNLRHSMHKSPLPLPWSGFSVLFRKSTKNFGLAFLRVSCRRGCLKRPLRASNLVGVSVAIPTVPPFTPQNPTAEIIARTPMLCRFVERESLGNNNVLRPRGMAGASSQIHQHFPF